MKTQQLAAFTVLCGVLTGCATIVSQGTYPVKFSTIPPGAEATIRDENARLVHQAETPFEIELDAHDGFFDAMGYRVHLEKDCYESADASLDANLDEWYWGNFLFGGLIGFLLLDPGTGDMWELEEALTIVLKPSPQCSSPTCAP